MQVFYAFALNHSAGKGPLPEADKKRRSVPASSAPSSGKFCPFEWLPMEPFGLVPDIRFPPRESNSGYERAAASSPREKPIRALMHGSVITRRLLPILGFGWLRRAF
jgi:hypothetical protein